MKIIILLVAVALTGCASPPQWLADHYNSQDLCQSRNWPMGREPSYCGAGTYSRPLVVITGPFTQTQLEAITNSQRALRRTVTNK
jgi:hypothetical protein